MPQVSAAIEGHGTPVRNPEEDTVEASIIPENAVVAEVHGHRIKIECGFRDKDLVKQVPGATWSRKENFWTTRLSWAACLQLRGVFGDRLIVGPQLQMWSYNEYATRVQPCMELREAEDVPDWDEPLLYPRQKVGAKFLGIARQALLGDEVGAGKTRQVIKALEINDAYPAVIICTKSAKDSWAEEYEKIAPHRNVVAITGSAVQRRKQFDSDADVFIVHWQLLRFHSRLAGYGYIKLTDEEKLPKELNAIKKRAVVADEAHRLQDPKSKQTRAAWALADECWANDEKTIPGMKIPMTGTPVASAVDSAWPIFRFMAPDEYPSKSAFIDRYALMSWNPFGFNTVAGLLPERKEEFFKIFDPRFMRRPFKIVVPWVPDPIRLPPRRVELTGAQKKAYESFAKELIAEVEGGIVMVKNPLEQLTRAKQLALGTLYDTGVPDPKTGRPVYKLKEPSAVLDELEELLAELGSLQTIIFSESAQLAELAQARVLKAGYTCGIIMGGVPETERTARRHAFQAGQLQHMVVTMGAGGESLTFTAAKAEIFIERSFSLIKNKQAEGRAPRPGQEDQVRIIDILPVLTDSKGREKPTVMSRVHEVVVEKEQNLEEIVRDGPTLKKFLLSQEAS